MKQLGNIIFVLPKKISALLLLFALALAGGSYTADASQTRFVKRTVYECAEGWWAVRDGSRYSYPSDGKRRPSWHQRCRRLTVYVEQ